MGEIYLAEDFSLDRKVALKFLPDVFAGDSERMAGPEDSITRIAAQIVTGVGFIGAGAIIQDRGGIHGLTTAASIWLVASIGMACGAHLFFLAFITTLIAFVILFSLTLYKKIKLKNSEVNL